MTLTVLEPSTGMLKRLQEKLPQVKIRQGFTDAPEDVSLFPEGQFDLIISRQLVCGLEDPWQAFRNWKHWLKSDGQVIIIDGLFDKELWGGDWDQIAERAPLAYAQNSGIVSDLLRTAGFKTKTETSLQHTNAQFASEVGVDSPDFFKRYLIAAVC